MPDIHTYWIGGPPPDWARQGLLDIQQKYPRQSPEEQRNFWVHPSRIGPNNTGDETLQQMTEAADAAGFQVRIIADHFDDFAANMTRRAGSTGAWSVWTRPRAEPTSTPRAPVGPHRAFRAGMVGLLGTAPTRRWVVPEAD